MGYQLPELLDDARNETTTGEIAGMVAIVLALLIALRFLGLAWPALNDCSTATRTRASRCGRTSTSSRRSSTRWTPPSERPETRIAWARRRLARGRADIDFQEREPITTRGIVVIAWAGMRGVVTVAAAQTIPLGTPHRATVVLAAFLVALITLVLFGLTLPVVIRRMHFESESAEDKRDAVQALLQQVGETAIDDARAAGGADHRRRARRPGARGAR